MDNNTTLLISVALFILAVFGSSWLNLRQLTKVLEANKDELKAELRAEIGSVRGEIGSLRAEIHRIDQRIDNIEKRLDRIERQLDQIFKPIGTLGS